MRVLISAGEASGEMYGAQLIEALRRRAPLTEVFGVGGDRMRSAGCDTVVDAHEIAVVGLTEVISSLPRIWRRFHHLLDAIDRLRPDVAVLIDFPDFNLRLAKQLHRRGIPAVYFVGPQLWAWRPGRVRQIRRYVRKMLVIFPFEEHWFRERGVEAEYVGHPLADEEEVPPEAPSGEPRKNLIALLPGSRKKEVEMNLPEMLRAGVQLWQQIGPVQFVIPVAPTLPRGWLERQVTEHENPDSPFFDAAVEVLREDDARAALRRARAAVVASGTATVEAALAGTPFVMVYRVARSSWLLGRWMVRVPHFAMPNLIAGRGVVPELVQDDFTAENIVRELRKIIPDGPERAAMIAGLTEVKGKLRPAAGEKRAVDRAAEAVLAVAQQQVPQR